MTTPVTVHAHSDVGRVRSGNEDNYYAGERVYAVADGMGGHVGGEVASERALGPIKQLDGADFGSPESASAALAEAVVEANRLVVEHGRENPDLAGMGTTLTAALLREGRLHIAHVGDSRAYLLREGEALTTLTTDHTLVEQMVRDGQLSRDEAAVHPHRSVLTRALGVDQTVQVDTPPPLPLQPGDQVLLCSDGLTGPVEEDEIRDILEDQWDGDAAVQALIDAANDAGGPDNITVVLLRATGGGGEPAAAGAATEDLSAARDATMPLAPQPPDDSERPVTAISTRPPLAAGEDDWASQFGRYGQRQGAQAGTGSGGAARRAGKIVAVLLGVLLLVGLLVGGGYALMSRAYFVGVHEGQVAIFNGVNASPAGLDLFWLVEETDVEASDLSSRRQQQLEEGVPAASVGDARQTVANYEQEIERREPDDSGSATDDSGSATDGGDEP